MSSIQEIHALEERISEIVQDYVDGNYNDDDIITIEHCHGEIVVMVDSKEKIKMNKSTEVYSLKSFVRTDEIGNSEIDNDRIADIANNWIFLD